VQQVAHLWPQHMLALVVSTVAAWHKTSIFFS
jgi:hypothetical protein